MMSKKLYFLVSLVLVFFLFAIPRADSAAKTRAKTRVKPQETIQKEKYQPASLKDVNSYQLGTNEFILKLSGRDIPNPRLESDGNYLTIIIPDTKAANTKKINLLMSEFHQSVPTIVNFKIKNVSEDLQWRTEIDLETSLNILEKALTRSFDGLSVRIKLKQDDNNFVKFVPTQKVPNAPEAFLPFKMPNKINTEFRDAELRDVFRLIMEDSGKNVIIDNSFPKDIVISLTLVDIKAEEILNYLMNQYDLACTVAGHNTIAFGTREALYRLSGKRDIKSFKIAYADLSSVVTMLKNLAAVTDKEITQDDRMRTIHVQTNPAKMYQVEDIIKRLDVPAQQVMIRASIFEFEDIVTQEVQSAIEAVYDKWTFSGLNGSGTLTYLDETYSKGKSNFDRQITATLTALENKGKGRTVANPSVIAVDGQQAKISLKQERLYNQGINEKGNVQWGTEEVGPELTFTPKIEENGYIYLDIDIQTGDFTNYGGDEDSISTRTRSVQTKIRVRDGMPFVIGGLNQEDKSVTVAKVPVLGDIPLIGELFKWRNNEHNKTQAVMIVTPYILN
ncbi:MAG: hypothetical protein IJ597_07695 [Synergistaceae bacterium]|nr:hypothetical protein [Synergistaceae bacterium]